MAPHSNKVKGILIIVGPFAVLIVTLFLRVAVSFFTYTASAQSPAMEIARVFLNLLSLICIISAFFLVPIGIYFLTKRGGQIGTEDDYMAGRWERWLANFLDGLIALLPAFLVTLLFAASGVDDSTSSAAFWLVFIGIGIIQAYYLTVWGQTIGKKWLKIRIVDVKTNKIGGFVKNVLVRSIFNFLLSFIPFYSLVDVLFIFREDRRCVHDLIAGTIVVRADVDLSGAKAGRKTAANFCNHCSAKAKPATKFCAKCGGKLSARPKDKTGGTHPGIWVAICCLVVILILGVVSILAAIVIVAINPSKQLSDVRNAQRRADTNMIVNAVYLYAIDHNGNLPAGIPHGPQEICRSESLNCTGLADLNMLVGDYLVAMPSDPRSNDSRSTQYRIMQLMSGKIRVDAPNAENGVEISVVR